MTDEKRGAYTINEFAEAFRISRATVYNMIRDGTAPRLMRVRGRVLISVEAVEEWRKKMEADSDK